MNDYYEVRLKESRLTILKNYTRFTFIRSDINDYDVLEDVFNKYKPSHVINLAAQAGVRYSIENPRAYIDSNISGFLNMLEACRKYPVKHFLYASSSSVYGGNRLFPYSTSNNVDHPVSLYAATKKSNELIAHTYSHLYGIPTTGLRFFTVYGPWGRPDMAYYSFSKAIMNNEQISLYNHGNLKRDFTYIDDIVQSIYHLLDMAPKGIPNWNENDYCTSSSFAPYKIYNIGNSDPVSLEVFVSTLEESLGKKAVKQYLDHQPGDVLQTFADTSDLYNDIGYEPATKLDVGLASFADWFKNYYSY